MPYESFVYKWKERYYIEYLKNVLARAESYRINLCNIFPGSQLYHSDWRHVYALQQKYTQIINENPILSGYIVFKFEIVFFGGLYHYATQFKTTVNRLYLDTMHKNRWRPLLEEKMLECVILNLSGTIVDFLNLLKVTVHSSFPLELKYRQDAATVLNEIFQKLNGMTQEQQDRLKTYMPNIQFVHPSNLNRKSSVMLVDCTDPVNHLMKLLDQADENFKKINVEK
jgi:hypothetical protein